MMGERGARFLAVVLVLVATACDANGNEHGAEAGIGGDADTVAGREARPSGDVIVVGTTDELESMDPARVYDYFSSNLLFNVGETLVGFEPGEPEVSPLLAERVDTSEDGLTYTFTLREDVAFHDGSALDSEDVRFSLERAININHPQGAGFLLSGIAAIETPDEQTVEITLNAPDATFLPRLAYTVATIVPSDGDYTTPEEAIEVDGEDVEAAEDEAEEFLNEDLVASGPYRLAELREGESLTLEAFEDYWGDAPENDGVLIRFFRSSSRMRLALETGEIDVAFRELSPEDRRDLDDDEGFAVVEGHGASVRHLVFNTLLAPGDEVNVRRAVAAALDRERIVDEVFTDHAEPLYSMIPPLFVASMDHFSAYEDEAPETYLADIETPVEIDLHYGGERYGPTEPALARTIRRMLEETGLFEVTLTSTEWEQFVEEAWPGEDGQYPVFLLGWYPDYFDPDGYLEPFFGPNGFLDLYGNPLLDELMVAQRQAAGGERRAILAQIQQIVTDRAPIIPLVVQAPYVVASSDVEGLEETMDPVQIFRYYLLSKDEPPGGN